MPVSLRSLSFASLRQHRWFRPAVRALAALILLWLVTWLAVPPLAKGPLERIASERLGRAVTIGAIDFQPWSLEFALRDVAVAGANGAPPQLTIGRIYADGELQSILRLAPVVDAFSIENPVLRITHLGDGRYDVDDIIAKVTAPPSEPDTGPARLALYNLALTGGSVDFTDKAVDKTHEVRALAFTVPFVSTLPSQRQVKVEPHLAFALDGSQFDSSAQGTPFTQTGKADAQLRLDGLDLAPYLAYLPANLPIKVQGATLDADVKVAFEQHPRMAVKLTGTVVASGVRITDRGGADLLSYERLKIDMADVRPLEQVVRLQHIELTAPVVTATRDAAGNINLAQLAPPAQPPKPSPAAMGEPAAPVAPAPTNASASAEPASSPGATASTASASASASSTPAVTASAGKTKANAKAAPAWAVEVATAAVRGGTLRWADQTTRPAAALQATDFTLDVADVVLPFAAQDAKPFTFKGGLHLQGSTHSFTGEATDQKAQVNATLNALALQLAAPYLAQALEPVVTGQLTGDVGVLWQAPSPQAAQAGATGVTIKAGPLALEQLAVKQGKTTLASLGKLEIAGAEVPLDTRTATLERLSINQPQVAVERGADRRWMFERWLKAAPAAQDSATAAAEAAPANNTAPWKLRVADFSLQGGTVSLADNAQPRPVALDITALGITARNLASDGSKPEAFQLTARAAAPGKGGSNNKTTAGKLDYQGTLALQPLATQGQLDATRLPLHTLDGYLASQLAVELLRADVGYRGQVAVAQTDKGVSLRLSGDVVVEDLQANSTAASTPKTEAQVGEELLAWKSLNLRGLSVATAPGTAPRVEVKETSLVDFFARITINEAGRINLSDIAKTPAEAQAANAASAKTTGASAPTTAAPATAAASAPATVAQTDPLAPVVVFGPVSLVNGKVLFSDRFIKPNYSADLTELTGKLSAFSSEAPGGEPVHGRPGAARPRRGHGLAGNHRQAQPAGQTLGAGHRGQGARPGAAAAVAVRGQVRRLRHRARQAQRGRELQGASPMASSRPATRLVLNQLTFGDKVEGAPNSLPVKLAVALLADRNGVIDLDLPISGSLNDPQFRIGPVICKIIVNLIGKALTAPFSLLANAFGGGEEMSQVAFAPGSATLTPDAQQNLDKVVKALADRPALKITVHRHGQPAGRTRRLAARKPAAAGAGRKAPSQPGDSSPVSAAEYPALLKEVYGRADMPKPRNLVGLAKELTVPEMEALLLANQPATEAMATELATQRGQAIRSYLVSQKLPVDRLFVAAPKAGKQAEKWTPRADLSLTTQ